MTPKKLHRFLIQTTSTADTWVIDDAQMVHQAFSILKFKVGERCIVFSDGGDDITVEIIARSKDSMTVRTHDISPAIALPRTIIAAVSIAKGSSFELAVQKLTEVGVSTIVPLLSDRTVKQAVRLDRLQKISVEAVEQSGRNKCVTIHEPMTLQECFALFPFPAFVCDGHGGGALQDVPEIAVLYVGPEGGWSAHDETIFTAHTVERLLLGKTMLRTETAAIIGAYTLLWHS